ncbi:UDP-4-amino-4,6-dideoxy-N-acetyl-beta-L-altrosamine transaminase [Rhodohalobacter sp. 614A]|uniref:UDP-4-amino-4, 6-dideoxy-N-acetyl-beta-L-altrosamine transaminase n=1 Tax=Rhodohalobacter sp. 614A TaxID=2908649 RepID=UPI001F2C87C0|nr:UDP-4-amino-4,6-dideoxy-N-acetyl-beta-L-altrosamine transaminase [Rhodohalobacter sp. 614A]
MPSESDRNFDPIPYGRQHISQNDIDAVTRVLQSDYLTQGPEIGKFEEAFADYVGSNYAVAVSNGTAALHLCALALDVNHKSKVITTPITFSASANCIRYCGGEVDFADIDPETFLIDIGKIREKLEAAPKGTYDGIIPVDFAGRAVNLEELRKLADEFDLWIIEDACHAPGGFFVDSTGTKQFCGNGQFADLAIFSFHPVKHIATGEGGMITTNSEELYQKLLKLRTHGITKNTDGFTNSIEDAIGDPQTPELTAQEFPKWYMEMQELGYNYRLTDFQAALGTSQLARADEGLQRRREIAARYANAFSGKNYIRRQAGVVKGHAYHLYIIEVDDRLGLYNELRDNHIFAQIHYIPVHLMPYYKNLGWKKGDFKKAEEYYSGCISLPMYPTLTDEQQDFVIECIDRFYG